MGQEGLTWRGGLMIHRVLGRQVDVRNSEETTRLQYTILRTIPEIVEIQDEQVFSREKAAELIKLQCVVGGVYESIRGQRSRRIKVWEVRPQMLIVGPDAVKGIPHNVDELR